MSKSPISNLKMYDLVVLGTGTAGSTVATRCALAGWRVAIVESREPGGTCALRGCDPKKVLVGAAEVVDAFTRLRGNGPDGSACIDWPALMAFKRTFTEPVPAKKVRDFESAGIELVRGAGRFVDRTAIEVEGRRLEARQVVVATGATPAPLGIAGAEHVLTSDDFLELDTLPSRIVFIGGGYISFEFAHLAARAGARATILHRGDRPLEAFDGELVEKLVAHSRSLGIEIRTRAPVTRVSAAEKGVEVWASGARGEERFAADIVVHGGGRVPAIHDLALDAAGVAFTSKGITLNEHLQSVTNPAVWAAGDADGSGPALTPVAGHEARVVSTNLLEGPSTRPDYSVVPSAVFTLPILAKVGLLETEARSRALDIDVHSGDMSGWYTSRRLAEPVAAFKTITDARTGRLLGAHLLAGHAAETINLFALAMRAGLTAADVKQVLFAYPTAGSDVAYML